MVIAGRAFWDDRLLFRDYLRSHPTVAARYEEIKRAMARTVTDREAYQEAKMDFIASVLRDAHGSV